MGIPAVNVVSSCSISGCLEAAKKYGGPMIIQFSRGGGQFYAGKAAANDAACIAGAIAGALHVRTVAELYGIPVILHTDHCMRSWLPWFDGLIEANEKYFKEHGEPLFSSHMLDLSEEPLEENVATCVEYLTRMSKCDLLLEMELGVTGGEEDGVDNTDIDSSRLYTQPEEVWEVYKALSATGGAFTIAAAFGNVHGVYAPGNVELKPDILHNTQKYLKEQLKSDDDKPAFFVFHGGSGSSGDGIRTYEAKYHDYLQGQIGNPESETKPNKKYYDPRMALRSGEETMAARIIQAAEDLNCVNVISG